MKPTRCPVCDLVFEPNRHAESRCVAVHPVGQCCHVGSFLVSEDGGRWVAVAWPNCIIVPVVETKEYWLPDERSKVSVGCSCDDAMATVRLVERPGLTNTVIHCLSCHETRVIRNKVAT